MYWYVYRHWSLLESLLYSTYIANILKNYQHFILKIKKNMFNCKRLRRSWSWAMRTWVRMRGGSRDIYAIDIWTIRTKQKTIFSRLCLLSLVYNIYIYIYFPWLKNLRCPPPLSKGYWTICQGWKETVRGWHFLFFPPLF